MYLSIPIKRSRFYGKFEILKSNASARHNVKFSGGTELKKFGKEKGRLEELSNSVSLMSVFLARLGSMSNHIMKPQSKRVWSAKKRGTWWKLFTNSKTIFCRGKWTCFSKLPEERLFVVDSGASMHMQSKKGLSPDELDTLRTSRITVAVLTARGEVQTNEEAQVNVHDLDLFVTVQLLEETSAGLSLVKLGKEHRYSYEWISCQEPRLTKKWEEN